MDVAIKRTPCICSVIQVLSSAAITSNLLYAQTPEKSSNFLGSDITSCLENVLFLHFSIVFWQVDDILSYNSPNIWCLGLSQVSFIKNVYCSESYLSSSKKAIQIILEKNILKSMTKVLGWPWSNFYHPTCFARWW